MAAMFDMKMVGDKGLRIAMTKLPGEVQTKVMRGETRKSTQRLHTEVLLNLSGRVLDEESGALVRAYEAQKVRTKVIPGVAVVASFKIPTQPQLGMPRPGRKKDEDHYGMIQELGQPDQPPRPFMRKAVNDNEDREHKRIGDGLGKGVTRAWKRLNRAAV